VPLDAVGRRHHRNRPHQRSSAAHEQERRDAPGTNPLPREPREPPYDFAWVGDALDRDARGHLLDEIDEEPSGADDDGVKLDSTADGALLTDSSPLFSPRQAAPGH
jgi:hypothetical protein